MKQQTKRIVATGAVLSSIMLLGACSDNETTSNTGDNDLEQTDVTLYGVIDTQVSAQQVIADEMGFFEDEGLNVTNTIVQSGPDIGPLIASGDAEASFETTITNITLKASNVDNVIVAPMANISGTQAVIASPDFEINSAEDIEGATIGMVQGAGVTIALQNMADELGVDMDQVNFINMSPTDQIAALDNGNIDMMAAWEPWITTGVEQGAEFLFSGNYSELPGAEGDVEWMQYYSTFQVSEEFLEENPNTVKALLRALIRATEYINEDREGALDIMDASIQNLPREQIAEIMDRNIYSMEVEDDLKTGSDIIAEHLSNMGSIQNVPEFEEYTDFSLLEEIQAE
ncbi:ABC transporter substrate-binding protein [Alkalicoccobacillus murimartini]|uniref:NitT/TauT family transport system substrate-binding protein n=1 Tax=Alkalicoccobacillus murimartini TaxID=171685 RepID=A0ABT9YHJ9_9BACI|nr:ABC transporter substrate-binding protein [Alkalicoccobacillus murimartini]MDQ0207335.1 NitT/TauT family transport system substrate-binding protein [Alkalicoccobacillus murimartini]